jgi:two-component system cell cycle response regulator
LDFVDREMSRCKRHGRPLSVVLIDVDHFKAVNDKYGHLTGDFALRELAALLRSRIRRDECFAHYGGEEFCIVLPEATREDAIRRADELRAACELHSFDFGGRVIPTTFSAGVGDFSNQETPVALLERADRQLYEAKRAGRNRVH